MPTTYDLIPGLPPFRIASRSKQEYYSACPFCGGDHRSDRFRIWPEQRRYWCRECRCSGWLDELTGETRQSSAATPRQPRGRPTPVAANPADVAAYRQIYGVFALWAHANLLQEYNPEPAAYVRGRGLDDQMIHTALIGYALRDPETFADYLRREYPELLAHAEGAGVLVRYGERLLTHPNLRGSIVLPYIAGGEVIDLRTRTFPGKGYRSLAGGYEARGAVFPLGWDSLDGEGTVLITEGEFKALAVQQAYRDGRLDAPAIAHPGLSYFREEWGPALLARGIRTVVLAYDSQPRRAKEGIIQLAPEEVWSVQHGRRLLAAGLQVRVLRLPLAAGEDKADLDEFIATHGPARLQKLLDAAPTLDAYHRSLPQGLLKRANLPLPGGYPLHRARPQRIPRVWPDSAETAPTLSLAEARDQIVDLVGTHINQGEGFLALAHPPGTGKGYGTTQALIRQLQAHPELGRVIWTALRKDQQGDQQGLTLTPLHGRNAGNCRKFGEAQALTARGYSVTQALCARRCPFVDYCLYRQQFGQPGHAFAPLPLLQATHWWKDAGVIVLDEFDPSILARIVLLDSADLARIGRATDDHHAQAILRWLMLLIGDSADRQLAGVTLLGELDALATADGLDLDGTLEQAITTLPTQEDVHGLKSLPKGASLAEYEALAPNYLGTILTRLATERRRALMGQQFTSRLEVGGGRLRLYLRAEHLIQALSRPDQRKLILDATVSTDLLRALFPNAPMQVEQPRVTGGAKVVQVLGQDWAKTGLRGQARCEQWVDTVASHIRPGRPTLVVTTKACADDLRAGLTTRGHNNVVVAHYGALRGSNAYKGYDVILAQIYNPNLDAVIALGRALFADEDTPLDERVIEAPRTLVAADGGSWQVAVATFADPRLAALLEQHREAELVQAGLRGRPFDHPDTQITLLFSLPLPQLPPTEVREVAASPQSNGGRAESARDHLAATARQLLDDGARLISVEDLAKGSGRSVVTVRVHLPAIAGRLGLRLVQQRRITPLAQGGQRAYERWVLVRDQPRGRAVPPPEEQATPATDEQQLSDRTDQACNKDLISGVIRPWTCSIRHLRRRRAAVRLSRSPQAAKAGGTGARRAGGILRPPRRR
jgi:hypothetical protein